MKVAVSLPGIRESLAYHWPFQEPPRPGTRVWVPLNRAHVLGWVLGPEEGYQGRCRTVAGVVEDPWQPAEAQMKGVVALAEELWMPPAVLLDLMLSPQQRPSSGLRVLDPAGGKARPLKEIPSPKSSSECLRLVYAKPFREEAVHAFCEGPGHEAVWCLGQRRWNHYGDQVARTLETGRSVLICTERSGALGALKTLFPEALLIHSKLTPAQRHAQYQRILSGEPLVVLGGGSAAFMPLPLPGLYVHEDPFVRRRHRQTPLLDLSRVLEERARSEQVPLVAGSFWNGIEGRARLRRGWSLAWEEPDQGCPEAELIALPPRDKGIPEQVRAVLEDPALKHGRTLVLLREGVEGALWVYCPACRQVCLCPDCQSSWMEQEDSWVCSGCGAIRKDPPLCPQCRAEPQISRMMGAGTLGVWVKERLGQTLHRLPEEAGVEGLMADGLWWANPRSLRDDAADLFDRVVFIGPETWQSLNPWWGAEGLMHLLLLAATLLRKGGKYWIFSVFHFHYALRGCKDVGAFVEREEEYRRWFSLPPFALTVRVGFRGVTVRAAAALARQWRAAQEDGHRVLKTRVEKAGSRGRYHRVFLDLAWEGDARPVQVRSMSRDLSYEPFVGGVEDDG